MLYYICNQQADQKNKFEGCGLTNAMTDFFTHKKRKETAHADDTAFMSVTFDTTALNRFIEITTSMAR